VYFPQRYKRKHKCVFSEPSVFTHEWMARLSWLGWVDSYILGQFTHLPMVTHVSVLWNRWYADCIGGVMSLLSRNAWSRHWTILSNNLEKNDKFDTEQNFFMSPVSNLLFFNSRRILLGLCEITCVLSLEDVVGMSDITNTN